ncbi:CLUMA_CG011902, isoform A [Clunio marinus]|uniref:CLUMA_CG011902, isoform A n=1 Tax=Clunio marinus TaxID=568069 RepID=A0A1J1IE48_9DIPT|nr:CLUMA_CG011902, isoform A [Clunio marinus]
MLNIVDVQRDLKFQVQCEASFNFTTMPHDLKQKKNTNAAIIGQLFSFFLFCPLNKVNTAPIFPLSDVLENLE